MTRKLPLLASEKLQGARNALIKSRCTVGFDGFVDTILHVVAQRESAAKYTRMAAMKEFGKSIAAAAGLSGNFEFVPQLLKLGGNGPIMANALATFSMPVTYVGALGHPNIHPVFADFAKRARVISICEPGYTDAVEFEDGKLMFGKHASLSEVNWATLTRFLPEPELIRLFNDSSFVALVNWTMLPMMSVILRKLLDRVVPALTGAERTIFFDLADPAKRTPKDILAALKLIAKFESGFHVVLGLNFNESRLIGEVLGLKAPQETEAEVAAHAARIREKLKVHTVVIHPVAFAAAADASGAHAVRGPFTPKPKITTGAGDHFNAGFCLGRILGGDIPESLQLGVATSGFYVRNARSPRLEDLGRFLATL